MAHAAAVNALTEQLVANVLGTDFARSDGRAFASARQAALRGVRSTQYARVNHFAVRSSLSGLDEKFRVLDNDRLAEELRDRLLKLDAVDYQHKPEILSLLLHLSDKPVEQKNVDLSDSTNSPLSEPELTWAKIFAEENLLEDDLWQNFDPGSDDTDLESEAASEVTLARPPTTAASSVDIDSVLDDVPFTTPNRNGLENVRAAQVRLRVATAKRYNSGDAASQHTRVSETEATREALLMLQGQPTLLFRSGKITDQAPSFDKVEIMTIHDATGQHLLRRLCTIALGLQACRDWARTRQHNVLLERCRAAVQTSINQFERQISAIEHSLASPTDGAVVSLQQTLDEVEDLVRPLLRLSSLLAASTETHCESWQFLDSIYAEACMLQMTEHPSDFVYFSDLFLEILQVYLAEIRGWLTQGDIALESFFIEDSMSDAPLTASVLWHDRFRLRKLINGEIAVPRFLSDVAHSILAAGKRVILMRAIHGEIDWSVRTEQGSTGLEDILIKAQSTQIGLDSFAHIFEKSLHYWVRTVSPVSSSMLYHELDRSHGLSRLTSSLSKLYMSEDGAIFQSLSDALLTHLASSRDHVKDQFVLTELARNAFTGCKDVDISNISVSLGDFGEELHERDLFEELGRVKLSYQISWPLQNITLEPVPTACQKVVTLLLQIALAQSSISALQSPTQGRVRHASQAQREAIALRQRLVYIVDVMHSHVCQIGQAAIVNLQQRISATEDIDAMADAYRSFSHSLLDTTLLADNFSSIHQAMVAILRLSKELADGWQHFIAEAPDTTVAVRPVEKLRDDYDRLHSFVVAGLRGIARAKAEPSWAMLVERLS